MAAESDRCRVKELNPRLRHTTLPLWGYPGSTVAVAGPWKIKRDNRCAIYACRVASLDALTRGVRLAVDRRPGEAGLRDAEPRATIRRGDYVLAVA